MEGLALILFSQIVTLLLAVGAITIFSLFVQMSEGATFSVVPFVNRRALGSVAAGFLFQVETLSIEGALLVLGIGVFLVASLCFLVCFSERDQAAERAAIEGALRDRAAAEEGLFAPAPGD